MKGNAGDKQRILHIRDAVNEILNYVNSMSDDAFFNNSLVRSATVFQLEIIGEAANKLSGELKEKYNQIAWHEMTGMRNMIAHHYWGIDYMQVWKTVSEDIPPLKIAIADILNEMG